MQESESLDLAESIGVRFVLSKNIKYTLSLVYDIPKFNAHFSCTFNWINRNDALAKTKRILFVFLIFFCILSYS